MQLDREALDARAEGEIGLEGKVLVIRRIRVTYRLKVPPEHRGMAERVHAAHAEFCPVARSIAGAIEVETRLELEDQG